MRLEAVAKDGRKVVLKYAHEDLEVCVGIATAAFVAATLRGDVSACDRGSPPSPPPRTVCDVSTVTIGLRRKNGTLRSFLVACSAPLLSGACDLDALTAERQKRYCYR